MCVLTELRRPQGDVCVKEQVELIAAEDLFISALNVGELSRAIAGLAEGRKKRALGAWLLSLESQFAKHILPVDFETAHLWGDISERARKAGVILPVLEGLIAATALRRGLYIMTRNTIGFAATGVPVINPWQLDKSFETA